MILKGVTLIGHRCHPFCKLLFLFGVLERKPILCIYVIVKAVCTCVLPYCLLLCNCELCISPLKGICKCSALVPYGCHLHVYCN